MLFIVDENSIDTRLDIYLSQLYDNISRSKIQSAIKGGKVLINGEVKKPSYSLKFDDRVEFENLEPEKIIEIEPENIPLEVVWEDENMAVINKPSGMLTHPTFIETTGTLVNALLYKFGQNLSDTNGEFRRGIVHRLDRNTSGLLMIAKNNKTLEYLAKIIKEHQLTKKYHAVLKGFYPNETDIISEPIGRNNVNPKKMAVRSDGRPSLTKLKVLEHFGSEATYVELELITGRTHQIRVHLNYIGHPIVNDPVYGRRKIFNKEFGQMLHSKSIKFIHPVTEEKLSFEVDPPEEFYKILEKIKNM